MMRHPVSTPVVSCGEFESGLRDIGVVFGVVLPSAPENADPCAGEDSGGVLVGAASCFGAGVDVGRPWRGMPGIVGEAGDGLSESVVAALRPPSNDATHRWNLVGRLRPSKDDATAFARGVGDGTDAGFRGEMVVREVALSDVAEFGEDLSGSDTTSTREGHDDLAVGELGDGVLDTRGQPGNLGHELFEQSGKGPDELFVGVGFGILSVTAWRGMEPVEELGRRAAPAIAMLGQE